MAATLLVTSSATSNYEIHPLDSNPYGKSYVDWAEGWAKWAFERAGKDDPINDVTGEMCPSNQSGPVWYLTGTYGGKATRDCTIPSGKSIFYPVAVTPCSNADSRQLGNDKEKLTYCAKSGQDGFFDVSTTIDGTLIKLGQSDYRLKTPVFQISLPDKNNFEATGGKAGNYSMVLDGSFIMLKPLSPGKHEIEFIANARNNVGPGQPDLIIHAIYHLLIK